MKESETNIPSTATEVQPFNGPEQTPEEQSRLRKIGGKTLNLIFRGTTTGGAIFGMVHTLDPSLPPQYSLGGSMITGIALSAGADKVRDMREKHKAKKNSDEQPPENPEITETDTPVV